MPKNINKPNTKGSPEDAAPNDERSILDDPTQSQGKPGKVTINSFKSIGDRGCNEGLVRRPERPGSGFPIASSVFCHFGSIPMNDGFGVLKTMVHSVFWSFSLLFRWFFPCINTMVSKN